jgi:hypothetical protein
MRTDLLTNPIDGLDEALAAVDAFDQVLVAGLLRPGDSQAAGLARLTSAVAGTPLAARVAEAAEKAAAGTAAEDHFLALAAARTALLGSVHDALMTRIAEATGRPAETAGAGGTAGSGDAGSREAGAGDPDQNRTVLPTNLLAAARSWLADLARSGWRGLDSEVVSGSAPVISALLPDLRVRRLAALLDGFAAELAASCPGASMERFPARRWADLWSRAMLLTVPGTLGAPAAIPVAGAAGDSSAAGPVTSPATGRLLPLGIDLHEHATAVQAQVHAVFEPAGGGSKPRLVRASISAPKTDTIVGAGGWQLLRPHLSLLAAISEGRAMDLVGMPLTAAGDLLWDDEHARLGEPADSFATARVALSTATVPATAPLDRHPAGIAVPVFLEGYSVSKGTPEADGTTSTSTGSGPGSGSGAGTGTGTGLTFTVAGHSLAVDTDRIPVAGPLTPAAVAKSGACIGLLRWDAGAFVLQPLAVETTVKKKPVTVHAGGWAGGTTDKAGIKAEKAAADAATVLRERAGRLLRK